MRVLVTGGCGYVGSVLVPKLLERGHEVRVVDIGWFGDNLPVHRNLELVKRDICDPRVEEILEGVQAVMHLAAIADDPCSMLNPVLTWETGVWGTALLLQQAKVQGVERFVHASSGSIYGSGVVGTEDAVLRPDSYYNRVKLAVERVVLSHANDFPIAIVRPASICGYSPRMRLETSINRMVISALSNGAIQVKGPDRSRPLVDIQCITDTYVYLLEGELSGIYNSLCINMTMQKMAELVSSYTKAKVEVVDTQDTSSYEMSCKNFEAVASGLSCNIGSAVAGMVDAYHRGLLADDPKNYNLNVMQYGISSFVNVGVSS